MEPDVTIEPEDTKASDSEMLDDSVVAEENASATIKELREKLRVAQTERLEYLTGWQRAKADLLNARKRDEEDQRSFRKRATEDLILELIPVLQSFDSAMAKRDVWEKVDKNWRTGVEYIAELLRKVLLEQGLTEINPLDLPFDPTRDEPIENVPSDASKQGTVIEVVQKGYALHGVVVRPPRVKIGA